MEAQMRIPENAGSAEFESARRWQDLGAPGSRAELYDQKARETAQDYARNIEAYIGTVSVPVGIAGPIRINGKFATRDYRVPLATTEAALVASYNRGAGLITAAGGCNARVVSAGVSRTPMFAFSNIVEASLFADFIESSTGRMQAVVPRVTRFGRLQAVRTIIEGNHVYLELSFTTGDAAGQNMVTFATDAVLEFILDSAPVRPRYWFLEANLSGDKKATGSCLTGVRGKRVIADVVLSRELVESALHTPPERMVEYWSAGAIGGVMSGATGIHGHYANGLAALFLACGQDVACVAEAASGITRLEMSDDDHLYASVTLPNVIVGTVGGGTGLPSARACLDLLGLAGPGHSEAFAELCASIVLAGELSIIGAFCSGDFADAHRALSRGQPEHLGRHNV